MGIPQENVVLEFEPQGASTILPPARWAEGVKHSLSKGYKFRYWEIGNETYSRTFGRSDMGQAFPDSDTYARHFLAV